MQRCPWCESADDYVRYHDEEWGVPVHDDRAMFEMLVLETAQAGLSWLTVLRKREGYRRAFAGFDAETVAAMGESDVERLVLDPGIIRNRAKIKATIGNARAFLRLQAEHGGFSPWLWGFVDGRPLQNRWTEARQVPATTPLSDAVSKELKRRGFGFVGSTVVYAHLQATGLVNDHLVGCFRHGDVAGLAAAT